MSRRLSKEEIALWRRVADKAEPMHPERPAPLAEIRDKPGPKRPKPPAPSLPDFKIGSRAGMAASGPVFAPGSGEGSLRTPLHMDKKTHGKMKRGKMVPEGRLDLHGMTLDQAHPALINFILSAQARGKRLVLVITGKGKTRRDDGPIPQRPGLLRHNVPQWLAHPMLAQAVLQVAEAHTRHGGGGAYYVYLRKTR